MLSIYVVVAVYSTVYSYRRLHRPGVSKPVRNMFLKKHFLYVLVFIILWMVQQSNNYFYLFNPALKQETEVTVHPVTVLSGVMAFSTGIFLTLVRLYEPLFRVLVTKSFYQFFGEIYVPELKQASSIEELNAQDQALS